MRPDSLPAFLPPRPGQRATLLYCQTCLEVRLLSPYDAAPSYRVHGDALEEEPDQEREVFLRRHQDHSLAILKRRKNRISADRPAWDPFRTAYEEVTNGRETFLLKSWRTDLSAPRQYTLLRGALDVTAAVILPEEPLRDTLARSFAVSPTQLAALMKALQRTVTMLPPEELIPAYCSADDPRLSFAYLAESHLRMLVHCCNKVGLAEDEASLRDFFFSKRQEEELMVEMWQHCRPHFA